MPLKNSELKRTELARGTREMSRATGLKQGTSQLARSEMKRGGSFKRGAQMARYGPIQAMPPKAPAQRIEIVVFASAKLAPMVELPEATSPTLKPPPKRKKGMKTSRPKMTPIRASAQNEECTLRFPCCNHRVDTTVLCHRNGAGAGMKAADTDAAYGCYECHIVLDGHKPRPQGFTREAMLARFEVAVGLTHVQLAVKGLIRLLEGGGVEVVEKAEQKKQKPTPAGTGVGPKTHQLSEQLMTEKIVPQINSVVSACAREKVALSAFGAFSGVSQ